MKHLIRLGIVLYSLWVLLSGHFNPLLLGLGAASALLVLYLSHRMDVADHEGQPIHLTPRALPYWCWLAVEMTKANLDVLGRILRGRASITPSLIRVKAGQRTDVGRVTYANSITMTPGTVTIAVQHDDLDVHALTERAAEGLRDGEMNRRVRRMEGGS